MNHVVQGRNPRIGVCYHRKIERGALSFLDVEFPLVMCFDRIDRQTDGFHVALVPFGTKFSTLANPVGQAGEELLGLTEQNPPTSAKHTSKGDPPLGASWSEIGGKIQGMKGKWAVHRSERNTQRRPRNTA